MVIGIVDRVLEASSAEWTRRRIETKWLESFSDASGDSLGAHRLQDKCHQHLVSKKMFLERDNAMTHNLQ